jgi:signal transduction histidine kinase
MEEVIKILLIDDDEEDFIITRDLFEDISRKKYELHWLADYAQAKAELLAGKHDVYLVDYHLGIRSGLELISEAVQQGCTNPLILLTGQGDPEIDKQATKAGAADYLIKGSFGAVQLERAIRYSLEHARHLKQIRQLNTDLERRVEQRTRDLAEALQKLEESNRELQRAQKETAKALAKERELNSLKSKFVTMASHEFRTPLSTISSSASLIAKYNHPSDEEKRKKHVDRIKSSVNNLTNILNDFLSLSKLEEGITVAQPVELDLPQFAEEVTEEMSTIVKSGQFIDYQHQGGAYTITTDKHLLKNVLINLLSNAIKYSNAGQPIQFTTLVNGQECLISVRDYGIGIPQEEQVHLFSQFFRAHNVTNIQGTGLGLTIVKKYVELLRGTISFSSQEGQGTTFTVRLPLA